MSRLKTLPSATESAPIRTYRPSDPGADFDHNASDSPPSRNYQFAGSVLAHFKVYPDGATKGSHHHNRAELLFSVEGVMEVVTKRTILIIPPQRAVWIPSFVDHSMRARGAVSVRNLYFAPGLCPDHFPGEPSVVNVTPLLRELVVRAMDIPPTYGEQTFYGRLVHMILDEITFVKERVPQVQELQDKRLVEIQNELLLRPGNNNTLERWGEVVGASSRTLARLFHEETGASFTQWRALLRVLASLPRISAGESVSLVAFELGYETPSAFSFVFRRMMGTTPSEYLQINRNKRA
jgi:AraC-like DNA-binding protein/mannose-6-phosphate isomerase-like protein (cupin superfamily)